MADMAAREGASSARRRRDRQLRAWHRHVRTTVAMELATALHHSAQGLKNRVVEEPREEELPVVHKATSGQIATPPWGVRPAHPLDVSAQPPLVAATCVAAGVPSLSSPALCGDCSLDSATVSFLVRLAVGAQAELDRRKRREEEEKAKKAKEAKESSKQFLDQLRAKAWRELEERLDSGGASSKWKRKKRRKRRTPRTSSLPGCARRRLRQWFACCAGFTGDDIPRVMFPSGVARPKMLDIMAGLVQMDSYSGMARVVLLVTLHLPLCFLSLSSGPSWPVWTRRISSGLSPYSALCLVRQRIHAVRQFTEYFIFYVYWWIMDPQVENRPVLFQRLLGSTVNTSLCVSLRGWSSWSQCTSRCVSFVVLRPEMPVFMASMDLKDSFMRGAAHHRGHLHPRRGAETGFHGLTVQQTIEIPRLQFLDKELTCPLSSHTGALAGPGQCSFCGVPQLTLFWTG